MALISDDFPVLRYLLSHINSGGKSPLSPELQESVLSQFPHLTHPRVLTSMIEAIPDEIRQTQFILNALGPCPSFSSVEVARAKIVEINSNLEKNLEEFESLVTVDNYDRVEKEREMREAAEKEMQIYRAVVRLEETHQSHANQFSDLQEKMIGVYDSIVPELEMESYEAEINEEVVRILKAAESRVVEKVDLSGKQLKILPEAVGKIQGLLVLNISKNQLQILLESIAALRKLEELHVSSNLLEYLPDSIGLLLNLRILNVSRNKLKELPETIAHCSSLVELDASFNKLTCLPTNLGYGLVNLEKLLIPLNKIRFFPASLSEMKSLRVLDAHFNELCGIPASIGRLKHLQVLNLSNNFRNLTSLPLSIGDLSNLTELDLSNNQIQALPDSFHQLEKLIKLNLDQNPLVIPPIEIANIGVEAVMEFMREGRGRSIEESHENSQSGWLGWGSSIFTTLVAGVSQSVEDTWDQQNLMKTHGWINGCDFATMLTFLSKFVCM